MRSFLEVFIRSNCSKALLEAVPHTNVSQAKDPSNLPFSSFITLMQQCKIPSQQLEINDAKITLLDKPWLQVWVTSCHTFLDDKKTSRFPK